MKTIHTIDLWTEQKPNHYVCFNGAFVDGFDEEKIPFDCYKIIKNCNCEIQVEPNTISITNKHHAIIFYKENQPVRLIVINRETDMDKCIQTALHQYYEGEPLFKIYEKNHIEQRVVDLQEEPIFNGQNQELEIDVGSCDRWSLLYSMLKGSYTESETSYGNYESDRYEFIPHIDIQYTLQTNTEYFEIHHRCAFINDIKTRLIPIQENSPLTK